MSEPSENGRTKDRTTFSREVGAKAARKLRAQQHVTRGVWFGLGMMGLILFFCMHLALQIAITQFKELN